jgi:hypothetical protein
MPRKKTRDSLIKLAWQGAEVQVRELLQEIKYLLELFPDLRDSFEPDELPVSFLLAAGARSRAGRRRQRRNDAAAPRVAQRRRKRYARHR